MKLLISATAVVVAISLSGCKETEKEKEEIRRLDASVQILHSAQTMNELEKAVGDLGIVLAFPDGAWMAIRYLDTHEPVEDSYSLAVVRDSEERWFYSDYHFCGYLSAYRHTIMGKQGLSEQDIDTNFAGIHAIATSPDLTAARKNLKRLNFRGLER